MLIEDRSVVASTFVSSTRKLQMRTMREAKLHLDREYYNLRHYGLAFDIIEWMSNSLHLSLFKVTKTAHE